MSGSPAGDRIRAPIGGGHMRGLPAIRAFARFATSPASLAIGLGLLLLGVLFHAEARAAVQVWIASTAYTHCWLVLPIAVWLAWDRRAVLRTVPVRPAPWAALLALPVAAGWFAAERLGIMEGRQLMALTLVELLALAVLGWRMARAAAGPLLYLYFLVPFGAFLVPWLQDVTTVFVRWGLSILGVPAYVDGWIIEIPEGVFVIAEACAGLRFLIASIAFGCLYALLMYRSTWRRAGFILASIVVPIVANGLRALGIVWLGHVLGSAEAAAADHVLYGWIFFSIVILLLVLLGLPFREDEASPPRPAVAPASRATMGAPTSRAGAIPARSGATSGTGFLAAALLLCVVAATGPALAAGLERHARADAPPVRPLAVGADCVTTDVVPIAPRAGAGLRQRVTCDDLPLVLRIVVFSPRSTAEPVLDERRRLDGGNGAQEAIRTQVTCAGAPSPLWTVTDIQDPPFAAATALWVGGAPAALGLRTRLRMAWTSLAGGAIAPVLIGVMPEVDWTAIDPAARRRVVERLEAFLRTNATFAREVPRLAGSR